VYEGGLEEETMCMLNAVEWDICFGEDCTCGWCVRRWAKAETMCMLNAVHCDICFGEAAATRYSFYSLIHLKFVDSHVFVSSYVCFAARNARFVYPVF
jgi:hypothetical protein